MDNYVFPYLSINGTISIFVDNYINLNLSAISMTQMIIGRDAEKKILQDMLTSGEAGVVMPLKPSAKNMFCR